MPTVQEFNVN